MTLRLSPSLLANFPADTPGRKTSKTKLSIAVSSPTDTQEEAKSDKATPASDATPRPEDNGSLAPPQTNGVKRKATSAAGPAAAKKEKLDENGNPKPRGKPGPKKRKGL